jgi:tetratricopeptide (TPR) repeat protein
MPRRATTAQFRGELDPPTISEPGKRRAPVDVGGDDRRTTLDLEFAAWAAGAAPRDESDADEWPTETKEPQDELGPTTFQPLPDSPPLASGADATDEEPRYVEPWEDRGSDPEALIRPSNVISEVRARSSSLPPQRTDVRARKKETVWEAVEERYKSEGHHSDLLEMYLQRVEGTNDLVVKRSLFMRIGQLMRDEMKDPQQALDNFVEALLLEPRDPMALAAIEELARSRGWWVHLLATMKREIGKLTDHECSAALCEHAVRWAEAELSTPEHAEPFLAHLRKIDPGHPLIHRRLAVQYGQTSAWGAQRESLERALLRARAKEEQQSLHLQLAELTEHQFNEYTEAGKHYEIALDLEPRSLKALQGLERVCRQQGRFGDLVAVLEQQVEASEPGSVRVETLVRLADVHEQHFLRPGHAANALEEALQIDPRHLGAMTGLERCYQAMRAWPDLVRVLEARAGVVATTSEQSAILARMAEVLELKMGEPERATRMWLRVWDKEPANERALAELARLAERARDWAAAAAYRSKLADFATTNEAAAKIHVAIAEMLAAPDRDPKLARVHYEKAVSIHPATPQAWEALEKDARRVGDRKRTALFLEKRAASTESPRQKAQLFVELAAMRAEEGDAAAADLAFERAIKADSSNEIAAEAMLSAHVRERRWAEALPLCDVLIGALTRETNPERSFSLHQVAARIASELGLWDRAFLAALAAHRTLPCVESAIDLVECAHEVRHDAASVEQCAVDLASLAATPIEMHASVVAKLARLRMMQGAEHEAVTLFSRALDQDPDLRDGLEGLAEILVKREDWERACAIKQKLARSVADPEEQFLLLVEAGDLWSKRALNMPMGALAYEEALALKPNDQALLHTLVWVYGELACWEKLVETLRTVSGLHTDRVARAKTTYAMAMVVRDHLADPRRAAALLEEVLDTDPKRLDAFERVVRVYTELRDWMELKHAYGRMLRRLKGGGDVELRHALFFQLGLIYRDRLGDAARALDAFRAAQRIKPDEEDVRKAIGELFVVTDQLDDAINLVRTTLKKRPLDPILYGELYELFLRKRSYDRAWCAVDALIALGAPVSEEKARFYTDYPPPVLAQVPGTLAASAWRSHLLHGELDAALTTIFAIVTPIVIRSRVAAVPFQQLRRSLGEPLRANGALATEVIDTVADACEILGFAPPSLHGKKGQTVPLALAPSKNAMYVSIEACEALSTEALSFVIGKRLAEMRPELVARAACPSLSELRGMLQVAQQLAEPDVSAPTTGNAAFDKAFAQSITRDELTALRNAMASAKAQGSDLDVLRWSNLADVSASRVGLLLAGRVDAAKRGIASDPQMAGDMTPRDKLSELLPFSVSDEYAELRHAIGMAVDSNAAA